MVCVKSTIKNVLCQTTTLVLAKEQSGNQAHQVLGGIHGTQPQIYLADGMKGGMGRRCDRHSPQVYILAIQLQIHPPPADAIRTTGGVITTLRSAYTYSLVPNIGYQQGIFRMLYGQPKITLGIGEHGPLLSQADHRILQRLMCLAVRNPPLQESLCMQLTGRYGQDQYYQIISHCAKYIKDLCD
jgi:hypothetical protein